MIVHRSLPDFLVADPLLEGLEVAVHNDCDGTRDAPPHEPLDWRRWLVVSDCDDREGT